MNPRGILSETFEIIPLKMDTVDVLAQRTEYSREELIQKLAEARGLNQVIMFTLFRLQKQN